MIVIDNRTGLSYEEIGLYIDKYFKNSIGETNYYKKEEQMIIQTTLGIYSFRVNHGKNRLKFTICEIII